MKSKYRTHCPRHIFTVLLGVLTLITTSVSFVRETTAMANLQEAQSSLLLSDGNFIYQKEDIETVLFATFANAQRQDTATTTARTSEMNQMFAHLAEEYTTAPQVLTTLLAMQMGHSEAISNQASQDANWLGLSHIGVSGVWEQGEWSASRLSEGFYAFYNGQHTTTLTLSDGTEVLALAQNAATYALQYYFAGVATNHAEWAVLTGQGEASFYHAYQLLFGDPLDGLLYAAHPGAAELAALATLKLPWTGGENWNFTGGPHGANSSGLDWQPAGIAAGCADTIDESHWVVAAASGKAVADEGSYFLKLDHDNDGNISTGWQSIYGHTANKQIATGASVVQGQRLGHPSCLGGTATGRHVHFALKFQNVYQGIDGQTISGWTAHKTSTNYYGTMTKPGQATRISCYRPGGSDCSAALMTSDNAPSTCCACSSGLTVTDTSPLGGELIGPLDPQAEPAVTFDLTAPGDFSSSLGLPEVAAEDALPPQLDALYIEDNWSSNPAPAAFTWPAAVDEDSGVAGYHVYWGPDENGTAEALVTEAAYAPAPPDLTGGAAVYYLRVAPVDNVGNLGAWQTVNVQRYDAVAPAGTIEVSGGEVVPTLPVTLNLAATDEHSGIAEMRFSSDGLNWSEWEPYAAQRGWQLADVDGSQTIYVQFRDVAENMSTPVSAVVTADLTLALPSSTNYRIARSVMGMGGGTKNSSTYRLQGTSGQSYQTGQMQSGSYRVASGYWAQTVALSNQPPNAPSNPIPAQNATNIAITTVLSWSATDPDNDPLTYKVRFGTTNPPPQVVAGQSATTYDPPGDLAYSTTYYWQTVANDGRGGETIGPVWSFTTDETADNTQPEVTWIAPAVAHNSYDAYGELVTLKANATDNRGVTKVRFDWWDNTAQQRVLIGEDTTAPYEVNLDTNSLRPGCHYVNAGAFDAAGNFREDYIFICLKPPLAPSLNTIANSDQDGTYTVSWSVVDGATGYSLEEQFNSGSWQAVSGVSGTSRGFTGKSEGTWCYRVSANNNAGAGAWSANQCTTVAGAPSFPNTFYISPANNKTIGGIKTTSADILRYEKSTNTWTMIYDGSVRGTPKNVSAFHIMDDGSLLLVFGANQKMTIDGNPKATATPYDVIKFTPNNPNAFPLGGGTFSWFFQGKPNGLSVGAEKIDSLDYAGNRLLLSTTGTANVTLPNGTAFKPTKEDVFVFNRTTDQWESTPVIDGSMIPELKGKNISSVWDDPNSNDYYVTITGAFKIGGVKGNAQSIVKLTPNGSSFTPSFVDWLAPGQKFPSNLDGLDIAP